MLFFGPRRPFERIATSFRWLEPRPLPAVEADSYSARYEGRLRAGTAQGQLVRLGDVSVGRSGFRRRPGGGGRAGSVERAFRGRASLPARQRRELLLLSPLLARELPHRRPLQQAPDAARGVDARARARRRAGAWAPRGCCGSSRTARDSPFTSTMNGWRSWRTRRSPRGASGSPRRTSPVRHAACSRCGAFSSTRGRSPWKGSTPRWRYYAPVSPAARVRLAETLYASGSFDAAAVQLRKGLKDRDGTAREHFLLAECYMQLSINEDALGEMDRVLALEPAHPEAGLEKANILYLSHRLLEARDCLQAGLADGTIRAELRRAESPGKCGVRPGQLGCGHRGIPRGRGDGAGDALLSPERRPAAWRWPRGTRRQSNSTCARRAGSSPRKPSTSFPSSCPACCALAPDDPGSSRWRRRCCTARERPTRPSRSCASSRTRAATTAPCTTSWG